MACGSTPRKSISIHDTAWFACVDFPRSTKNLFKWLAKIATWRVWRPQHRKLHELDDHLLSDIGISMTATKEVRRSELYQSAWRDSK